MKKFNLKKHATKVDVSESYPKRLSGQNSDRNYAIDSGKKTESIQLMLNSSHKESDSNTSVTVVEDLMNKDRAILSNETMESQIGSSSSYWPHRQHTGESRGPIKPNDTLSESYDQKYYERFASEQEAADTEFWDKQIGVQLSGEKTTIVGQVPASGSQLQNHPDRFKKVKDIDLMNSDKVLKENKEMTYASALKDLDSKLFQLYYKAAKADRELTLEENNIVASISTAKADLLNLVSK